jgi:hypothetical protein
VKLGRVARGLGRRPSRLIKRRFAPRLSMRRGPHSLYTRLLDGETLWVAVGGQVTSDSFLRLTAPTGGGEAIDIPTEVAQQEEGTVLSGRLVLYGAGAALEPRPGDTYDLVVVDRARATTKKVLASAPVDPPGPTKTPPTRDNAWQFSLRSGLRGEVQLTCDKPEKAALVHDVSATQEGLEILCEVPSLKGESAELRVVSPDGGVLVTASLEQQGDRHIALICSDDVELEPGAVAHVIVASGDEEVPLQRWANDLTKPGMAVQLPAARGGEVDRLATTLRLIYQRDGSLALRRPMQAGDGA